MFPDYERLVLEDYQRKKSHGKLSSGLSDTTQARLKKECVRLCRGKIHVKDEKVIKDFCEQWDVTKTCLQNIEKYDVDKFKPLSNFLRGVTESTDFKNIQLLAWLIDFPQRPFDYSKVYSSPLEIQPEVETSSPAQMTKAKSRFRKLIIVLILLAIIPICCYWGWYKPGPRNILVGNGGCMYWNEDHYQQVNCNQKMGDILVIALDSEKLIHFRKITLPDTITEASIGKIWCVKYNGKYEYYTSPGPTFHPIDQRLRLKLLSHYIFVNHRQSQ